MPYQPNSPREICQVITDTFRVATAEDLLRETGGRRISTLARLGYLAEWAGRNDIAEPPAIPAPALEESLAEKLAAWRRRRKLRDLYDLDLFGRGALEEAQIRRLLVLKV
jgi:hypothetical protein